MSLPISVRFTVTKAEQTEGYFHASALLLTPNQRRAAQLWSGTQGALLTVGCLGLIWMCYFLVTDNIILPLWGFVLGLSVGLGAMQIPRAFMRLMAANAVAHQTETHMQADADGITLRTPEEEHRMNWAAIYSITSGKTAIFMGNDAVVYILPLRVLENPAATLSQFQRWKAASA